MVRVTTDMSGHRRRSEVYALRPRRLETLSQPGQRADYARFVRPSKCLPTVHEFGECSIRSSSVRQPCVAQYRERASRTRYWEGPARRRESTQYVDEARASGFGNVAEEERTRVRAHVNLPAARFMPRNRVVQAGCHSPAQARVPAAHGRRRAMARRRQSAPPLRARGCP
jgi:hypothetical protein